MNQTPLDLSQLRRAGDWAAWVYDRAAPANAVEVAVKSLDLRAVVVREPGEINITVRGTKDLRNWLLDLDVRKEPLAGAAKVKVHAGFLRGANALLPGLVDALLPGATPKSKLPPLRIEGHSLGGSLGSLIALALLDQGFDVQAVTTFGSPRVGNAAWRDFYAAALGDVTLRVAAAGDLVPLVPGVLAGYRHVGQEIFLDGRVWLNPSRRLEIAADSWRALMALKRGDTDFMLEFHSMQRDYLPLIPAPSPAPPAPSL